MKFGIIGTSSITDKFIEAAVSTGKWELHSIYSRTMQRCLQFGKRYNCNNVYTDFDQFASSNIEVVYIASPNSFHAEQCEFFLNKKLHVICEKPMALSKKQLMCAYETAEKNNVYIFEAYRHINSIAFPHLKKAVGKIGNIKMATFNFCRVSSKYNELKEGKVPNVFNCKLGGGAMFDIGVYPVSVAIALWGKPKEVAYNSVCLYDGVDVSGTIILKYDDFLCNIIISKVCDGTNENQILGENGNVVIDGISSLKNIFIYKNNEIEDQSVKLHTNDMVYEASVFADGILNRDFNKYRELKELSLLVAEVLDLCKEHKKLL